MLPLSRARHPAAALGIALLLAACAGPPPAVEPAAGGRPANAVAADTAGVAAAVRAVLDAQVVAWNEGSVRGFMDGYARRDSLTFLSGTTVRQGWEPMLYSYLRSYPDAQAMGVLSFAGVRVRPLSERHAHVWGRWQLRRDGPLDAQPGGLFTLLFERLPEGWRVVHDHTSGS